MVTVLRNGIFLALLLLSSCALFRSTGEVVKEVGDGTGEVVEGVGEGVSNAVTGTGRAINKGVSGTVDAVD